MTQENVVIAVIIIVFFIILSAVAYIIYSVQHQVGFFARRTRVEIEEE
jgi:hypothetical protein